MLKKLKAFQCFWWAAWILLVFVSFVRQWSNISSHLAPFFCGFLAATPQNNPGDVEYFPSVFQKGELNPGGFTWFAQGQAAFAPNSLLEVLDHISIVRALPGGKSGLEAPGIPWPVLGEKREPSWECGNAVSSLPCNSPGWWKRHFAHGQELPKVRGLRVWESRFLLMLTSQGSFTRQEF